MDGWTILKFTPSPSFSFNFQILSQHTQLIFLFFFVPPHKNTLCILVISWVTYLGSLKNDIKYIGILLITKLINTSLPHIERCLPFQLDNFLLTFSIIGLHVELLLWFALTRIPRNLNGITSLLNDRNVVDAYMNSSFKFTPYILILKNLICNPYANLNTRNITLMYHKFLHDPLPTKMVSSVNCEIWKLKFLLILGTWNSWNMTTL